MTRRFPQEELEAGQAGVGLPNQGQGAPPGAVRQPVNPQAGGAGYGQQAPTRQQPPQVRDYVGRLSWWQKRSTGTGRLRPRVGWWLRPVCRGCNLCRTRSCQMRGWRQEVARVVWGVRVWPCVGSCGGRVEAASRVVPLFLAIGGIRYVFKRTLSAQLHAWRSLLLRSAFWLMATCCHVHKIPVKCQYTIQGIVVDSEHGITLTPPPPPSFCQRAPRFPVITGAPPPAAAPGVPAGRPRAGYAPPPRWRQQPFRYPGLPHAAEA